MDIFESPAWADFIHEVCAARNPRTRRVIRFSTKGNIYLYYRVQGKDNMYCYTPHPCEDGWYYSFVYQAKGKGARSKNPKVLKMTRLAAHRRRKAAHARAIKMYDAAHKKGAGNAPTR